MKRILPLFALLAAPAFAQEADPAEAAADSAAAPAAESPAAPAAESPESPAAEASEAPALPKYAAPEPARRVPLPPVSPEAIARVMPRGPKFDRLPPDEKEHIRKMAEYRIVRDDAERELLDLDKAIDERRAAILEENEEAKELSARIAELQEEFAAATNALERIFRADEKLVALAAKAEPARLIVESSQYSLNAEAAAAMGKRMSAMRKAYEEKQAAQRAEAEAAAAEKEAAEKADAETEAGEAADAAPALPERPADTIDPKDAPAGTVPGVSPDVKPPLFPRRPVPAPAPAAE